MHTAGEKQIMFKKMRPPRWPKIRKDSLTPFGYGPKKGGKPAFCTESPEKHLSVYLPHNVTIDSEVARSILEQAMPKIDSYLPGLVMGAIVVNINAKKRKLYPEVAFWHVLLRGKKR